MNPRARWRQLVLAEAHFCLLVLTRVIEAQKGSLGLILIKVSPNSSLVGEICHMSPIASWHPLVLAGAHYCLLVLTSAIKAQKGPISFQKKKSSLVVELRLLDSLKLKRAQ